MPGLSDAVRATNLSPLHFPSFQRSWPRKPIRPSLLVAEQNGRQSEPITPPGASTPPIIFFRTRFTGWCFRWCSDACRQIFWCQMMIAADIVFHAEN
jgi:hypothetical protein